MEEFDEYENNYAEVAARDFARSMYAECDREDDEDDREEQSRAGQLQGVCKDCGNGTLNNNLNPAFELVSDDNADDEASWQCVCCGSTHLDLL